MKELHRQELVPRAGLGGRHPRLAALIIAAQEDERARIARDLHDDICQQLSLVAADLDSLCAQHSRPAVKASVEVILEKLYQLNAAIHRISHQLHPSIVRDVGLAAAIEGECRAFADRHGLAIEFVAHSPVSDLPDPSAISLFRITQEALNNIAKHAVASEVRVSLDRAAGYVYLRIQDSGVGFDPGHTSFGLGLTSMRERMALVHGSLSIQSAPNRGTLVEAAVPVRRASTTPQVS